MRNPMVLFAAALCVAAVPVAAQAPRQGVAITFLANEGVLLTANGRKVLVDALFEKYKTGFALPADSTRAALATARPPFDGVDALLFTHYHGDHFHPAPVVAHMRANPRATLVTSRQVIDSLHGRLRAAVEHLGYIVELGGRRVLHLGDTDFSTETFAPFRLDTLGIDVALIPEWALLHAPSRAVVQRWIRPRQIVAFHVGEGEGARVERELRRLMPAALTFSRERESRTW